MICKGDTPPAVRPGGVYLNSKADMLRGAAETTGRVTVMADPAAARKAGKTALERAAGDLDKAVELFKADAASNQVLKSFLAKLPSPAPPRKRGRPKGTKTIADSELAAVWAAVSLGCENGAASTTAACNAIVKARSGPAVAKGQRINFRAKKTISGVFQRAEKLRKTNSSFKSICDGLIEAGRASRRQYPPGATVIALPVRSADGLIDMLGLDFISIDVVLDEGMIHPRRVFVLVTASNQPPAFPDPKAIEI